MKKVMLVIVCLLFAATAFAQQSDPSNDVGYVKLNSTGSGTPGVQTTLNFGLPFKFWTVVANVPQYGTESTRPSSIIGSQIVGNANPTLADRIVRQDGGAAAFRNGAGVWSGTLETGASMVPGRAYAYQNKTGVARTLVLAGDVDNAGGYGTISITGGVSTASTPISWRDSRNIVVATQVGPQLIADGFTGVANPLNSDQLVAQNGGATARVNAAGTVWGGTLTQIVPGQPYNVQNRPHPNGTWIYDYQTGAAAAMNAGFLMPTPSITKAPMNNESVKTSSVKSSSVKTTGAAK
ncbi:MAG: hypothetical protein IPP40_13555 [bacterium]|nr:hypothetical protein [bacterium]